MQPVDGCMLIHLNPYSACSLSEKLHFATDVCDKLMDACFAALELLESLAVLVDEPTEKGLVRFNNLRLGRGGGEGEGHLSSRVGSPLRFQSLAFNITQTSVGSMKM